MNKVNLGDVVEINPESLPANTPASYSFRYIDLGVVNRGVIDWAASEVIRFSLSPSRARRIVREGDCLFGTVRPLQQSHAFIDRLDNETIASTGFAVLRAKSDVIDPRFLYHSILSDGILRQSDKLAVGSNYPAISESDIAKLIITLPALVQQRRIADTLDSHDSRIAAGELELAKQRSLKEAALRRVMGPGLRLIHSVAASRLGVVEGETSDGWSVVRLGLLLRGIESGNSPDLEDRPAGFGEWGVLKVSAVGRHGFQPMQNKVARDRSLHDKSLCVKVGDMIMNRANTADLVGLACIIEKTLPNLMLSDKNLRLIVDSRRVPAAYVNLVLAMPELRTQIQIAATGSSASMKNISQSSVRDLMVPFAEHDELERVCKIDAEFRQLIGSQQQELLKIQSIKRGLMEDLLSGRVRV